MKNIFKRHKELQVYSINLLLTSALLSHSTAINASAYGDYDSNYQHQQTNYFDYQNEQPTYRGPSGGYHSPDQLFFPIDEYHYDPEFIAQAADGNVTQPIQDPGAILNPSPQAVPAPQDVNSVPTNGVPVNGTVLNTDVQNSQPRTILINFNNVGIIEYIRFISRTTNRNFIFDENDLQFNVTIISEEPATIENIMTALLQELRIHDLTLLEQGNNLIIHKNPRVNAVSQVIADDIIATNPPSEIVTQVFKLNTADPSKVAAVIKPLTSEFALVEVLSGTNHLIITDLSSNVAQIAKLIKSVDSPNSGLVVGQYVVRTTSPDALIDMAQRIISPISQEQPFTMVPWPTSNSIFIVSTPYIVERTLSILQHIDQNQKSTKIFELRDLKYNETPFNELPPPGLSINGESYNPTQEEIDRVQNNANFIPGGSQGQVQGQGQGQGQFNQLPGAPSLGPNGGRSYTQWQQIPDGNWVLQLSPQGTGISSRPPEGRWTINPNGDWSFSPGQDQPYSEEFQDAPKGQWILEPGGTWTYKLDEGESPIVRRLSRASPPSIIDIPLGAKRKSLFSVYKLQYRKGDAIQRSLQQIASSLMATREENAELIDTLISVQWMETSNSLIFTGFQENLIKMRELMAQVDTPLRQVYIEMLVLETSVEDSLEYSVTWGTRFAGDHWAGGEGFNQSGGTNLSSPLNNTLNQAAINGGLGSSIANNLFGTQGLNIGVIGQKIVNTALGVEFSSISGLLQALRLKNNTNVILNPKILAEDGVPAEIFVGENISFKTQSISNDQGNNITTNFQFQDVGTRLRVTPRLGNNDIISLEIAQEISAVIPTPSGGANINNAPQGPNTSKSTTTTRVHLPSGYFLIISGMLRDQVDQTAIQVPCLGALPIIGAAFKDKNYGKRKRNQMIFIRPQIIETEEEIQNITKHAQDIWEFKRQFPIKQDWIYESEEALDFLNLRRSQVVETDPFRTTNDW